MPSVLILDDDAALRALLREAIEALGVTPILADDVGEALWVVNEGVHFDLLVLDLTLPGISGLDFYRRLTSQGLRLGAERLRAAGEGDAVLLKLFDLGDFVSVASALLRGAERKGYDKGFEVFPVTPLAWHEEAGQLA